MQTRAVGRFSPACVGGRGSRVVRVVLRTLAVRFRRRFAVIRPSDTVSLGWEKVILGVLSLSQMCTSTRCSPTCGQRAFDIRDNPRIHDLYIPELVLTSPLANSGRVRG